MSGRENSDSSSQDLTLQERPKYLNYKDLSFYTLIILPILFGLLLMYADDSEDFYWISESIVRSIVSSSSVIKGDLSLFGEITPVLIAGTIITLAPSADKLKYLAIVLSFCTYILYLMLSVHFSEGPGVQLINAVAENSETAKSTMLTLISNIRVMAFVIAASLLGYKLKT